MKNQHPEDSDKIRNHNHTNHESNQAEEHKKSQEHEGHDKHSEHGGGHGKHAEHGNRGDRHKEHGGEHDKHSVHGGGHDKHSGHGGGHDKHAGHHTGEFKKKFWISLIITFPVLVLSPMIQDWLGFEITFTGDRYVLAALSTFIFFYGGWPFLKGLYDEVRQNAIGMMTLIGVAITAAWSYSFAVTLGLEGMDFYWEMATLVVIMLFGHWMEMKSVTGASQALELLVEMMPSEAHLIKNGETKDVAVQEIAEG
jgi:P-type Cu2+ transporter